MAFVSVVLLWPLLLILWLLSLLKVAFPVISWVLLILHINLLAALLLVRYFWRKSGAMSRTYPGASAGWKRALLLALRYGLVLLIIWEVLLTLTSAGLVIWGPALLDTLR